MGSGSSGGATTVEQLLARAEEGTLTEEQLTAIEIGSRERMPQGWIRAIKMAIRQHRFNGAKAGAEVPPHSGRRRQTPRRFGDIKWRGEKPIVRPNPQYAAAAVPL